MADGEVNPYTTQSARNLVDRRDDDGRVTYDGWSAGEKSVDFNAQGLTSYLNNVVTLGQNLQGHAGALAPAATLANQGFGLGAFREGMAVRQKMGAAYLELTQYLQYLVQAHQNIAMSVQTVKDALGGGDDAGAVSPHAGDFAHVQPR